MIGKAVPGDQFQGFSELRVKRGLSAGDGEVIVAERLRFRQNLFKYVERQKQVAVLLRLATIYAAKTVSAVQIADVVEFDPDSRHSQTTGASAKTDREPASYSQSTIKANHFLGLPIELNDES